MGGSGGVNSLDFYLALLKSLGVLFLLLVCTFFTMVDRDNEFAKFTVPTSKRFLKACSLSVSGNEHELVAHAIQSLKPHLSIHLQSSGQTGNYAKTFVIRANARGVAFVMLHNSRFNLQCEPTPTQKSTQKWQLQPFRTSAKDY